MTSIASTTEVRNATTVTTLPQLPQATTLGCFGLANRHRAPRPPTHRPCHHRGWGIDVPIPGGAGGRGFRGNECPCENSCHRGHVSDYLPHALQHALKSHDTVSVSSYRTGKGYCTGFYCCHLWAHSRPLVLASLATDTTQFRISDKGQEALISQQPTLPITRRVIRLESQSTFIALVAWFVVQSGVVTLVVTVVCTRQAVKIRSSGSKISCRRNTIPYSLYCNFRKFLPTEGRK